MTAGPDTQRAFFALWPTAEALDQIEDALEAVRASSPHSLHWQPRHRLHLTVLFLGQCRPGALQRARSAGRAAAKGADAGPLQISGAGTFGPVLWLGLSAPWLPDLHHDLCRRLGLPAQRHGFQAHVTVARSRGARPDATIVDRLRSASTSPWRPDALTLVTSTTGPHPNYEILDRFAW